MRRVRLHSNSDHNGPILITGASGTLGQALARECEARDLPYVLTSRRDVDIASEAAVLRWCADREPSAIINACGYVRVDDAETDVFRCWRDNVVGAERLATAAALRDIPFVSFSSDLVFDGLSSQPYVEDDVPHPLSVYGRTKAAAETAVLQRHASALVIRTAAFFGADSFNFVSNTIAALRAGQIVHAASDAVVSPTYVPDLAAATIALLLDRHTGLRHVANAGAVTWAEFARLVADKLALNQSLIEATPLAGLALRAPRPHFSVLASQCGTGLRGLDEALDACLARGFTQRRSGRC